jgi:peptidoglycan LD-endopeptidase LytH
MAVMEDRRKVRALFPDRSVARRLPWLVLLLLVSCRSPEIVPEPYRPTNAHEAYLHSLQRAQLVGTALGRDWLAANHRALHQALPISTPYEESLYVDPAEPFAAGYRFHVIRGQRTEVAVSLQAVQSLRLFTDLFRVTDDEPVHVATAAKESLRLAFEPRQDGDYLLRIQPELLRGGRLTVNIRNVASLAFPVDGQSVQSIWSGFGAPRDGGRRSHHGVDIFAPRHTPVRAPSRAWVRRVNERTLGGRVVWLRDEERSLNLYFAHLQTQDVVEGAWVDPGDVIGTVGNTGNARTTPPHLHFGIYVRDQGPIDPFPFIHQAEGEARGTNLDLDLLGGWVRARNDRTTLRLIPNRREETVTSLDRYAPLRVLGATAGLYRVGVPGGSIGFAEGRSLEPAVEPIALEEVARERMVLIDAAPQALVRDRLAPGDPVPVLGRFGGYLFIETGDGRKGWLATE